MRAAVAHSSTGTHSGSLSPPAIRSFHILIVFSASALKL
jgi:hypothetical protein